jgi:hypothetical protein
MKSNFFKQYNVKGIGALINVFYTALPVFGVATNVMECGTFYGVQKANIHMYAPWLSFQLFLLSVIIIGVIILVGFYKFIYPSYYAFLNQQTYIHQSPVERDLTMIKKNLKAINKKMGITDEELNA